MMLYLDNAATTHRKPAAVYTKMFISSLKCGNAGRGVNKLSMGSIRTIISAQEAAAELFGMEDECNIVFTQNATYALNTAILGSLMPKDYIAVSAMDHNSILRPAALHGRYRVAAADDKGYVSPREFRRIITGDTRLAVCTHISNVCGTIQPVFEIARVAHNKGAKFLLDASQSAGCMNINIDKINADMIACPGHKGLMGPMGTGILCIKNPKDLRAVITGGTGSESESINQPESMPDKFHSGTMNIPAITGLREGIRFVLKEGAVNIGEHERRLAKMFCENICNMPKVKIYGISDCGIVAFNIEEIESGRLAEALGSNVIVRAGYHCAPLAHKALGTDVGGAVRVSFGYFNSLNDVKKITDAVFKAKKSLML